MNHLQHLPKEFDLTKYDECRSWGSMKWYKALHLRALRGMRSLLIDGKELDCKEAATQILMNPLSMENPWHDPILAPIVNQTTADYFEGAMDILYDDPDYCFWFNLVKSDDEGHIEVGEAFGKTSVSLIHAWEMHRKINPDRSNNVDRFFISVDLRASDELLYKKFREWITRTRAAAQIESTPKLFDKPKFKIWCDNRYLPFLDLSFWAKAHNKTITYSEFADILFNNDESKSDIDVIRKTIKKNALAILSEKNIDALKSQAYHHGD